LCGDVWIGIHTWQVWLFVEYILRHEEKARDDILTFLFQLSYCHVGEGYSIRALTDTQQKLLAKFSSFGLILLDKPSGVFYPTDVAVNLIFGALPTTTGSANAAKGDVRQEIPRELRLLDPKQLSIIVETNYQVGASVVEGLYMWLTHKVEEKAMGDIGGDHHYYHHHTL